MGRIIINNKSDLTDFKATELVLSVIKSGRISNDGKQYCYLSTYEASDAEYHVVTDLRKGSDSFTVYKSKEKGPIKKLNNN